MAAEFPKKIEIKIDEERYWQGLGRQEMDFHQVLGELIDNAISASGRDREGDHNPFTVEITIKRFGNKVSIIVADQGIGMTIEELTNYILSPGGKGRTDGPLNEHGFGLKNALCILTSGNKYPFKILSRDDDAIRNKQVYLVNGPFSSDMKLELDDIQNWNEDLTHTLNEGGTRIIVETSFSYFGTLYRKGKRNFTLLMDRLGEHLGVMYREYLKNNQANKIWLRWLDLGEDGDSQSSWFENRISPIEVPYIGEHTEVSIPITEPEGTAQIIYRWGRLAEDRMGDNLSGSRKLSIYYQGNMTTQGVDIVIKGRTIKTGQFSEIWEIAEHNYYNEFVGELILDDHFRTVNNKIAIDPNNPYWINLREKLKEDFIPPTKPGKKEEQKIKIKLKSILEGHATGSNAQIDYPIWAGSSVKIDICHEFTNGDINIYEVKDGPAGPLSVYQLLMYWDGVVKDLGKSPILARLVAEKFPDSVRHVVEDVNSRKDKLNNQYLFELKTIEELI